MPRRPGEHLLRRPIPKKLDGTGYCSFQASSGTYELLKIDGIPYPSELLDRRGDLQLRNRFGPRRPGGCSTAYRVELPPPEEWPHGKNPTRMFVLSSAHINETLFYLAEYWRQKEIPFIGITNKDGTLFRNAGLRGSDLIYVTSRRAG